MNSDELAFDLFCVWFWIQLFLCVSLTMPFSPSLSVSQTLTLYLRLCLSLTLCLSQSLTFRFRLAIMWKERKLCYRLATGIRGNPSTAILWQVQSSKRSWWVSTDQRTNGMTDQQTNGPMDQNSKFVACSQSNVKGGRLVVQVTQSAYT